MHTFNNVQTLQNSLMWMMNSKRKSLVASHRFEHTVVPEILRIRFLHSFVFITIASEALT